MWKCNFSAIQAAYAPTPIQSVNHLLSKSAKTIYSKELLGVTKRMRLGAFTVGESLPRREDCGYFTLED